jgi:hypothetical protein
LGDGARGKGRHDIGPGSIRFGPTDALRCVSGQALIHEFSLSTLAFLPIVIEITFKCDRCVSRQANGMLDVDWPKNGRKPLLTDVL